MDFEDTPLPNNMDIEDEGKLFFNEEIKNRLTRSKSEVIQKYYLHFFVKKFQNFTNENSLLFKFNTTYQQNFIFSSEKNKYYSIYSNLLVYSKNTIRLYNLIKYFENFNNVITMQDSFNLQLISEFQIYGKIQKVILYERGEQIYFIVALNDAKISILFYAQELNILKTVCMFSFENIEMNKLKKGRVFFSKESVIKKDPYNRAIGFLINENVLVLLVNKEIFPFPKIDFKTTSHKINTTMNDCWKVIDIFGPSIYFELRQNNIHNPIDFDFLWNSNPSFCILNERMTGENGMTKEVYVFIVDFNFFAKKEYKRNEKIPEKSNDYLEFYPNYIKYVNLAHDCYKIISLNNGGFLLISPCLIYYIFGHSQYILSLKPNNFINEYYKNIPINENIVFRVNPTFISGQGLIDINYEIINERAVLFLNNNEFYILNIIFNETKNVQSMNLKKIVISNMPNMTISSFSFIKTSIPTIEKIEGILLLNTKSGKSNLIYLEINTILYNFENNINVPIGLPFDSQNNPGFYKNLDEIQSFPQFFDMTTLEEEKFKKYVICGGIEKSSNLFLIKQGIHPEICEKIPFEEEISDIFTLKNPEKNFTYCNFIIISTKKDSSIILYCDENFSINDIVESIEYKFIFNQATIFAKIIKVWIKPNEKFCYFIVQATQKRIRLLDLSGKNYIDVYKSDTKNILKIEYMKNNLFLLTNEFKIKVISLLWLQQKLNYLNNLKYYYSIECLQFIFSHSYPNLIFEDKLEQNNQISTFSTFTLKLSLNPIDRNQKYLVVAFSDGRLAFYDIIQENKEIRAIPIFECPFTNEGLPFLKNTNQNLANRSFTDPSHSLKMPIFKKNSIRIIEEIYLNYLGITMILIIRLNNNEFFIYKGLIIFEKDEITFIFNRIELDINFTYQNDSNSPISLSKNPSMKNENENSLQLNFFESYKNKPFKKGISKHKYSNNIQTIYIYNCVKSFTIFEKTGELYFHSLYIEDNEYLNKDIFIDGFATLINPDSEQLKSPKGCIFLINNHSILFAKFHYNEDNPYLKLEERNLNIKNLDYQLEVRSHAPFLAFSYKDKTFEKIIKIKNNNRNYFIVSCYYNDDKNSLSKKYELLLLDPDSFTILSKHEFSSKERVISLKNLIIPELSKELIGISLGIYSENEENIYINSKFLLIEITEEKNLFIRNEIFISDDLIGEFFFIINTLFICVGTQINSYDITGQKPFSVTYSEKTLLVSSSNLGNFVNCGDIKKGFVFYILEEIEENKKKKFRLKQICQETISTNPVLNNELFYINNDLRVITNDPLCQNIGIYRIFKVADDKMQIDKIGDFSTTYKINKLFRISKDENNFKEIMYCTDNGYIGSIFPVYGNFDAKLILGLQNELFEKLPFIAGLNPKEFRNSKKSQNEYIRSKKNIIDYHFITIYGLLTISLQKKIANLLSCSREEILNYILQLDNLFSL